MNKLKQYNWYKIGFLSVCGAVFLIGIYFAVLGYGVHMDNIALDRVNNMKIIQYCNEDDNMVTKAICNGADVGIEVE